MKVSKKTGRAYIVCKVSEIILLLTKFGKYRLQKKIRKNQ